MTRLHYLILRNRKRTRFGDLPQHEQTLFHRAPDRASMFEIYDTSEGAPYWRLSCQKSGFYPNLIYRIRSTYAPAGMADFEKELTPGKET